MNKLLLRLFTIGILFSTALLSCKDDDEGSKPTLEFATSSQEVKETAGTVNVELKLDKPFGRDIVVEYELRGTAIGNDLGTGDYTIVKGRNGKVTINKGETSALIALTVYADDVAEPARTVEFSIVDVSSNDIVIGDNDNIIITIVDTKELPKVSFASSSVTVTESGTGITDVSVTISEAPEQDLVINYTLDGTALDSLYGYEEEISSDFWDYHINGTSGEIIIPAGETSAQIEIEVYSDLQYEDSETIILKLTKTTEIELGDTNTSTITVNQENGKVIALLWDNSYTNVDMDMFLWVGEDLASLESILGLSAAGRTTPQQEVLFLPAVITDGAFGLSHVYYSGTPSPMNFQVHFIDFVNGVLEAEANRDIFSASYTSANKNPWNTSAGTTPIVVQTFTKVDGNFVGLTDITIPSSGSRVKVNELLTQYKKTNEASYLPKKIF